MYDNLCNWKTISELDVNITHLAMGVPCGQHGSHLTVPQKWMAILTNLWASLHQSWAASPKIETPHSQGQDATDVVKELSPPARALNTLANIYTMPHTQYATHTLPHSDGRDVGKAEKQFRYKDFFSALANSILKPSLARECGLSIDRSWYNPAVTTRVCLCQSVRAQEELDVDLFFQTLILWSHGQTWS